MNASTPNIQAIVLAAGASSRYGNCKLLEEIHERSLLQHTVDTLAAAGMHEVTIVSGAWHEALVRRHPELPMIRNLAWQRGMGQSIAFAASHLRDTEPMADALLVALADQPAIASADYRRLIQRWRDASRPEATIVCSTYAGRRAVPAVFPRSCFEQLCALDGDSGARHLLRTPQDAAHAAEILEYPLPAAARDIDTPEDWRAYGDQPCKLP